MVKQYRVVVHKLDRKWCSIDIENPWAIDVLKDIRDVFCSEDGYTFEVLEAVDEKRICVVGPEGTKVLSREVVFKAVPISAI
ncbi:MAG: hypothetical protein ABL880_04950 [Methylotenera sp.]